MRSREGQVMVEMAAAIIAAFIFMLGLVQIFIWFNSMLVTRQEYYENSRIQAGGSESDRGVYIYTPNALNIFNIGGN